MLMDILVEVAGRSEASSKSLLLLGPPGVGTFQFSNILHLHMLTSFNKTMAAAAHMVWWHPLGLSSPVARFSHTTGNLEHSITCSTGILLLGRKKYYCEPEQQLGCAIVPVWNIMMGAMFCLQYIYQC